MSAPAGAGLDRLWAGWRAQYLAGLEGAAPAAAGRPGQAPPCLFCGLAALADEDALVVERTALTFTVMNAYPYTSGHVMVAPTRHEATLGGLRAEEAAALMAGVQRATLGLGARYGPDGINVGVNLGRAAGAGVPGHVHAHVLPRWHGDTNFMTSVADARVLPEPFRDTWERLRAVWPGR